MNKRRLLILVAITVAVVAVALLTRKPSATHEVAAGPLYPAIEGSLDQARQITVLRGNGSTTLKLTDAGWVVDERQGYPADPDKVRRLFIDLVSATVVEAKTRDPAKYGYLGVQELDQPNAPGALVRVETGAGEPLAALIIGQGDRNGGHYVRKAGEAQSFLVKGIAPVNADPTRWLNRSLFGLTEAKVARVEIRPLEGEAFTVAKPTPDAAHFQLEGGAPGRFEESSADALGRTLAELTLDDVQPIGQVALDKADTVRIVTFDGIEVRGLLVKQGETLLSAWRASFDEAAANQGLDALGTQGDAREQALKAARETAQRLDARLSPWAFVIGAYDARRFEARPTK